MTRARTVQLGLAATIALGAVYASFVPGSAADMTQWSVADSVRRGLGGAESVPLGLRTRAVIDEVMPSGRSLTSDRNRFTQTTPESRGVRIETSAAELTVRPRLKPPAGDGRRLGVQITAAPQNGTGQRWWIVAGAESETYVVSPDTGFRDLNLSQVGGQAAIGDAHIGVAFEVGHDAYASLGYVQQRRRFDLGAQGWEEEDHFLGAGFRARW
ncbi:hypothetical protein GCM10011367_19860 [Marinicauda pacifica]|uniref:Uncharacterized protein n=1 Tax=Marinicauda pacifica TaxID=1133559 RepID=A0A4S2H846_9PROT|nr:hypothetical protein [Marinicauda pacifica]TGY92000.1 hypothetical protein E5162_10020 [Marinicauda pacifica]GGE45127.1 hypothetical protein GCM10011367_19860 [Marinicauda pacifica]